MREDVSVVRTAMVCGQGAGSICSTMTHRLDGIKVAGFPKLGFVLKKQWPFSDGWYRSKL